MSVTMTRADGVTVLTLTSDSKSACPPLCQILKGLCYSPVCCSVSERLRRVQRTSQTILGALQIMVGLLNIGLGVIIICVTERFSWTITATGFPFWLGGLFTLFGTVCILSEKYPSPCLVLVNVILNLAGVALAIAGIVLYSINIVDSWWLWSMCRENDYNYWYESQGTTTISSAGEEIMRQKCLEGKTLILMLLRGINAVLIVMSALELCLVISSVVLGIKALRSSGKGENKSTDGPEYYKPLLEEVTTNPAA